MEESRYFRQGRLAQRGLRKSAIVGRRRGWSGQVKLIVACLPDALSLPETPSAPQKSWLHGVGWLFCRGRARTQGLAELYAEDMAD